MTYIYNKINISNRSHFSEWRRRCSSCGRRYRPRTYWRCADHLRMVGGPFAAAVGGWPSRSDGSLLVVEKLIVKFVRWKIWLKNHLKLS